MATEFTVAAEATAKVHAEPINNEIDFDTPFAGTAWVKWNVKGGGDRTHEPYLNTNYTLEGTPNIQGVEIKASVDVKLICWSSTTPTGNPNITIDGPSGSQHKIDPRRLGSYRVEVR